MLRTKCLLKRPGKKRVRRIVWQENAQKFLDRGFEEIRSWKTHDWGERRENGEFKYSVDDLLEWCEKTECVAKDGEGNFKLPANWSRYTLQDMLEQTGFDPEA